MSSFLLPAFGAAPHTPLLIAAAADLSPLQQDLTAALAKSLAIDATFTFSGSGILARQIENGAPYDAFLSANEAFVRDLETRGKLVPNSAAVYALGRLGLWSRSGRIKSLNDLTGKGVVHFALPNPAHAPYGAAAREMLRTRGLWPRLESKVVYGENVRQTFQFAETGDADACITAWSLVRDRGAVLLPSADHPPIRQVAAVVRASSRQEAAFRVLRWLAGPEGRALLARYGFGTP